MLSRNGGVRLTFHTYEKYRSRIVWTYDSKILRTYESNYAVNRLH